MLATARKLMIERESADFTLQEVSFLGKVSIGSIYFRFRSKDELVRAVIGQDLEVMAADEIDAIAAIAQSASGIDEFITAYIGALADIVKRHALMLGLAMRDAASDPVMSDVGEDQEMAAALRFAKGLALYKENVPDDVERRAVFAFHVLFATLARHIIKESQRSSFTRVRWNELIAEVSKMILGYIRT